MKGSVYVWVLFLDYDLATVLVLWVKQGEHLMTSIDCIPQHKLY